MSELYGLKNVILIIGVFGGVEPMFAQEILHWVRKCYGDELALNSDAEGFSLPALSKQGTSQHTDQLTHLIQQMAPMAMTNARFLIRVPQVESIVVPAAVLFCLGMMTLVIMLHHALTEMAYSRARNKAAKALPLSVFAMFRDIDNHYGSVLKESAQGLRREAETGQVSVVSADIKDMTPRQHPSAGASDISEPDDDSKQNALAGGLEPGPTSCPSQHEGRMILSESLPYPIDELFTLLFTYNKFNIALMERMKYTDVNVSSWEENTSTGLKTRKSELTVPVSQPVGPKICHVTETQALQACSKPGELYVIEVESVNAGVPYCDSFYVNSHLCLTRVNATESTFSVYSQIKYRKSVWGLVKGFIEKNVWAGMDDYFKTLSKAVEEETNRKRSIGELEVTCSQKRDSTRVSSSVPSVKPASPPAPSPTTTTTHDSGELVLWGVLAALAILMLFNLILYFKLSALESLDNQARAPYVDYVSFSEERSHEQWVTLLRRQASQHQRDVEHWRANLKSVVSLLKQAEESLTSLQNSVHSAVNERVAALSNLAVDLDAITLSEKHSEL